MRGLDTSATHNVAIAFGSLIASSATLVCCVLPAVLVAMGAGAALAGLVTAVPQLIWLSEHKGFVFGVAGVLLVVSSATLWRARYAPCPADPLLARACLRLRRISWVLNSVALMCFAVGVTFAFVLPRLI
jgi:hypothetical protein